MSRFAETRKLDAAEDAASRAINLVPDKGEEFQVCQLHRFLGKIYQSKRDKEKAINHYKIALEIGSTSNWHGELFWIHYSLAELFGNEHKFDDANGHIEQAKSHAVDDVYFLGRLMHIQALVWYIQRRLEDAKSQALHGIETFEQLGAVRGVEVCMDLLRKVEEAIKHKSQSTPSQR